MVHGYRQRTGPFRVYWSALSVPEKIAALEDPQRRAKLRTVHEYLMAKQDSKYSKFILMHSQGVRQPYHHEIFTAAEYQGIECALWPTLYYSVDMCETMLTANMNRASSKISFMHKVLSRVVDYSLDFDMLQFQYDRWLFKTITGTINSSRASGCSPNCALQ